MAANEPRADFLVPTEVSRLKLKRELDDWHTAHDVVQARGWTILDHDQLSVDVGFLCQTALPVGPLTLMPVAARFDFSNYDLWPPSVTFIDPISRQSALIERIQAFLPTDDGLRNVLVRAHPDTGLPFMCIPGVREYHTHPQHNGDLWLTHRGSGAGRLMTLCDLIWRAMVRPIVGIHVAAQTVPAGMGQAQLSLMLVQGEVKPDGNAVIMIPTSPIPQAAGA